MASKDLESSLDSVEIKKVFIKNLTDEDEVRKKLDEALEEIL